MGLSSGIIKALTSSISALLGGAAAGGSEYLDGILDSVVFDVDATKAESYSGTGTTWSNLVAAPADGSAQTDYDLVTGDGETSTTYPTFTGDAGDAAAYWAFDGGDYFTIKNGNTAFINSLHKTTGGSDFWIAVAWKTPVADATIDTLVCTATSTAAIGVHFRQTTGEVQSLYQRGDTATAVQNSALGALSGEADHLLIISHSHSSNETTFWQDSATGGTVAHTFNATTTDPDVFRIGVMSNGTTSPLPNGTLIYHVSMGNEYLDDAKAAEIIAHLETRHGRTYTA